MSCPSPSVSSKIFLSTIFCSLYKAPLSSTSLIPCSVSTESSSKKMPESPALTALSEPVSTINLGTEEQDVQNFKHLCGARLQLLQQQYHIFKDSLHRAMTYAAIWWAAHEKNDLDQKGRYGTKFIDDIIHPYLDQVELLVRRHEERFKQDDIMRMYFDFCETGLAKCFGPVDGKTMEDVQSGKGLTVQLAKVEDIQNILKVFRENFGRKILLEKAVHGFDIRHLITRTAEAASKSSWSTLWSTATREEDLLLWIIFPIADLEKFQLDAFAAIKKERIKLLEGKIEFAEDFWEIKLQLERVPIFDDNDEEWAVVFENSSVRRFELLVADIKLRLMKECNIFNFRFLGHLTDKVFFDEHLHLSSLRGSDRKDWFDFVKYRISLLDVEKLRSQNLQFCPSDNTKL